MKTNLGTAVMLLLLSLAISSCSNTKILYSKAEQQAKIKKQSKVLVIAMMTDKDQKLRQNMENIMVENLRKNGIEAGSSIATFGINAFDKLDEATTISKIKSQGYDGAFTIALLAKTKEKGYRPGRIATVYNPYRFWSYWNNYNSMFARMYIPPHYARDNKFIIEGNVFSLDSDQLVYSAQTKTINPNSPESLANSFTKTLLNDMYKNGVFSN
ncbi:MAG: hypothetical protein EOO92_13445 [Pedobacter sp.]|nr:MAG: hypothetical protein EOO92_13445 [Pedobacter sp.]